MFRARSKHTSRGARMSVVSSMRIGESGQLVGVELRSTLQGIMRCGDIPVVQREELFS